MHTPLALPLPDQSTDRVRLTAETTDAAAIDRLLGDWPTDPAARRQPAIRPGVSFDEHAGTALAMVTPRTRREALRAERTAKPLAGWRFAVAWALVAGAVAAAAIWSVIL
jgi:hypothetical protein